MQMLAPKHKEMHLNKNEPKKMMLLLIRNRGQRNDVVAYQKMMLTGEALGPPNEVLNLSVVKIILETHLSS